jgi:shikimate dehydrogenase
VPEVRIANRTQARAEALADAFGPRIKVVSWAERNEAMAGVALLVNTTTQGMHGQPPLEVNLQALPTSAMVSDAIYIPLETQLLQQARLRGHITANGLGMLLNQAVPAFEAWFGVRPAVTAELRAVVQATF